MKILLATNNPHKVYELSQKISERKIGIQLLQLKDVQSKKIEIEETGATIEENAKIKATRIYELFNIPSLADDTALEVDPLGGAPGIHSARFSGTYGDDASNRKKLLQLLEGIPIERRTARFRTIICFVTSVGEYFFEGVCPGKIIFEERGSAGFGYDSIFVPDGYESTFAELEVDEKNRISHRGRAIDKFLDFLNLVPFEKIK